MAPWMAIAFMCTVSEGSGSVVLHSFYSRHDLHATQRFITVLLYKQRRSLFGQCLSRGHQLEMLDLFTVLTTGGIVLWSKTWADTRKSNPINNLIQQAILDQKYSQNTFIHQAWNIQWTLANELGLIFVVGLSG